VLACEGHGNQQRQRRPGQTHGPLIPGYTPLLLRLLPPPLTQNSVSARGSGRKAATVAALLGPDSPLSATCSLVRDDTACIVCELNGLAQYS
jgi:hypothetical protein